MHNPWWFQYDSPLRFNVQAGRSISRLRRRLRISHFTFVPRPFRAFALLTALVVVVSGGCARANRQPVPVPVVAAPLVLRQPRSLTPGSRCYWLFVRARFVLSSRTVNYEVCVRSGLRCCGCRSLALFVACSVLTSVWVGFDGRLACT